MSLSEDKGCGKQKKDPLKGHILLIVAAAHEFLCSDWQDCEYSTLAVWNPRTKNQDLDKDFDYTCFGVL